MNFNKFEIQVPSEYQEVEYLTSNGTQYIDTGIIPTNSAQTKVQFEFQLTDITNGLYQSIGCNSNLNFTSSQLLLKFRSNAIEIADFDTAWHICEMSKSSSGKVTYFDGVEYSASTATEEALPFILFGMSLSSNRYYGKYKLKYFKCYENNTLVRNMIPVRRVSDNVLGMYDTVNDVFYVNQGTGTFEAGADVDNWHDTPHYIHNTSTDTIATLPADLYPNAVTATVGLKGNMSQSGTPTPQNPIQPSETGERTGNLFNGTLIDSIFINTDFDTSDTSGLIYKSIKVFLSAGTYTFSWGRNVNVVRLIIDGSMSASIVTDVNAYTITPTTDGYVGISFRDSTSASTEWDNTTPIMLNTGSTAKPFEPHGYKIPILSGSTTTPVYLGEVQTTRRIRKYEVTGQETGWRIHQSLQSWFQLILSDSVVSGFELCTHYKPSPNAPATIQNGEILVNFDGANNRAIIRDTTYTTLDDFKTYLQQQYANGTPVTVWYVLATPTTGIVNEPLRKIGDYADSVSGITIPTIAGANSFDVLTTLKPSEVTVNYKGWHAVSAVHERDNGAWT